MFKYISIIIFFSLFLFSKTLSNSVFISVTVNDEIITNLDIKKETKYLKILNPNLNELDDAQIQNIAKTSLINEIVKKKEIERYFDLSKDNLFVKDYFNNLYTQLNFKNEIDFENSLKEKKIYTINEIKAKLKIEIVWNELIYEKFKNQIKINKEELLKKIKDLDKKTRNEYSLSEIVFEKDMNERLDTIKNKIQNSISEIGFNNTANIFSISESSKMGGKLGWIDETNLSKKIYSELKLIEKGEYTNIIQIGKNFLILKIDDIRLIKKDIDKDQELDEMIKFETNKQLNQFSRIYFDKTKINYSINEK